MSPNTNIYAALLKGTHLDFGKATVWEGRVKTCFYYAKFGRRYRQRVRFLLAKDGNEFTLFQNAYQREYYKLPQWERKDADNEPVEPEASETYKNNAMFDDTTWSSSDDDGTLLGYDSSGAVVFCEHLLSGNLVAENQMVIPGSTKLKQLAKLSEQREDQGRIYCTNDPFHKLFYDEDLDDDNDPYLTYTIQRRLKRKRRRKKLEAGKQLELKVIINFEMNLPFFISAKQKRQMGTQNVKKAGELELLDKGQKQKGEERLGDN
jgi:hypothetical protein